MRHTHELTDQERTLRKASATIGSRVQDTYNKVVADLAEQGVIPEETPEDDDEYGHLAEHLVMPVLQVASWVAKNMGMPLPIFLSLVGSAYESARDEKGEEDGPPPDVVNN